VIGIDTNVLVRYFTQDDPVQAPLARRFVLHTLSAQQPGHVSLVCLAELVWVLNSRYRASVEVIVDAISKLLVDTRFVVQEARAVWAALDAYEQGLADFADALIAALDRRQGCTTTVTFDQRAARLPGMTLLEPAS
jgi:predicted nucleic-acid-binding protein